jgi:hypothetical protein
MDPSSITASQAAPLLGPSGTDPELESLPEPRRPWRRATLFTLGLVGCLALTLMFSLRMEVTYALMVGEPVKLGELHHFNPDSNYANRWVQGSAELSPQGAGFKRPLDPDRFRLSPVVGNPRLWVELREPAGSREEYFIPPSSFVGRLVPLQASGLAYGELLDALSASGQPTPPADAWILCDGVSPLSYRWFLGVTAVLLAIAGFCTYGLYHLAGPVRRRVTEPR